MAAEVPGADQRTRTRLRRLSRPPASPERVSQAERQQMCPDAQFHVPPADACGFPGCGWTADTPVIDPRGTCHLVGCPDKGRHAPHLIGCPDTFEPYERPSTLAPALIAVRVEDLAVIVDRHATCGYEDSEADAFLRLQRALATARNDRSS